MILKKGITSDTSISSIILLLKTIFQNCPQIPFLTLGTRRVIDQTNNR